jgi:arginine-tRNA-protein transferase
MVYSFYDAALADRPGLGTFIILDHITRAARAGLPFVYLGYWIDGCERMSYKTRYRPIERLTPKGWRRAED